MNPRPKIVFFHLLNDYSGSPRVLSQVIQSFLNKGYEVDIYTSANGKKGFLSDIAGANYFYFKYQWSPIKLLTLFFFFWSQLVLFFKLMRYRKQNVIFYINTVLPIGAAWAGKRLHQKVVYHIHETSIKPPAFKNLLFSITEKTAHKAIYVSNFLLDTEPIAGVTSKVIYNALADDFIQISQKHQHNQPPTPFTVLMLSSLKEYKGVKEFTQLASLLPDIHFDLVINSTQAEIDVFFTNTSLPSNLALYPSQSNVHPFYQKASLVVNLSHPLKWVETFGLTALEAMSYGIPVIVPTVGGIAEIVEEDISGYKIDVRNMDSLKKIILQISLDTSLYKRLSLGAINNASKFNPETMSLEIEEFIFS